MFAKCCTAVHSWLKKEADCAVGSRLGGVGLLKHVGAQMIPSETPATRQVAAGLGVYPAGFSS